MSMDFETFWAERAEAAKAYVMGDGSAVDALVPHEGEATFFGPLGDVVTGASAVARRYLEDSETGSSCIGMPTIRTSPSERRRLETERVRVLVPSTAPSTVWCSRGLAS